MARLTLIVVLIFMVVTMPLIQSFEEDKPKKVNWAKRLEGAEKTVTYLQFYFHDTLSGKNPSAVRVAQASTTTNSPTSFGAVMMADDPLTVGPDPSSKLIGRAQGLYGSAGQAELGLIMAINYGFIDGIYNGSSFSILGLNRILQPVREMAVVGGTGVFQLARGFALARTYQFDRTTGDAIVGYNVTIVT